MTTQCLAWVVAIAFLGCTSASHRAAGASEPSNTVANSTSSRASPGTSAVTPAPQGATQQAASDVALTPARILGAMAEAYKSCTSYRDSGVSMLKVIDGPIVRKPFKTAFVRPARFRFECSQWTPLSKLVFVVWTNGTVFKSYAPAEGWKSHDNLHLPLAAATGVSGGTAAIVPELLLPADVSGFPLTEMMTNVERLADADVGTARCYCLRGRLADFTITIWIDQQTNLLLRMERLMQSDGDEATEITTYEPEIDIQIGDADLELEPASK